MNGGQGDRTELRTMLPFQPSGLKYFTQQRLYICVCVFTYIKKGISLCRSTCGGLELLSKVLGFLCALKPTREESPSWPTRFIDVVGLRSKAGR